MDQPPWDELYGMVKAADEEGQEGAARVDDVVAVIVQAIESDDPTLRMPVGDDVKETIAMRHRLDDRQWEELVAENRPFTW